MRGTERYAEEVRGRRTGRRSGAKVTNYSYVEARGAGAAKTNEETLDCILCRRAFRDSSFRAPVSFIVSAPRI